MVGPKEASTATLSSSGREAVPPPATSPSRRLRVCIAGSVDLDFHHNRLMLALLSATAAELDIRPVALWGEREDHLVRSGKSRLALRAVLALPTMAWRFLRAPRPDVLFVGYPGHLDLWVLAPIAKLRGVPVVFDVFISLFDTVVDDRRLVSAGSFWARLLSFLDARACRFADRILVDTPQQGKLLATATGVPRDRFSVIWAGAEDSLFRPLEIEPLSRLVLFYGTFIPLHGVETVVRAAKLLEEREVRFRIIGRGQQRPAIERLMKEIGCTNVELKEPVPLKALPGEIARASVCLGIFGETGKASRVVPNKVYQALAMARPVVTANTPAVRSAFAPGEIATVPAGDSAALAAAVWELIDDPARADALARKGHARYLEDYARPVLARRLERCLKEVADRVGDDDDLDGLS